MGPLLSGRIDVPVQLLNGSPSGRQPDCHRILPQRDGDEGREDRCHSSQTGQGNLLVLSMFRNEILKRNIINEHELKKLLDGKLFGMEEQLAIEQEEDEGTEKGRTGEV